MAAKKRKPTIEQKLLALFAVAARADTKAGDDAIHVLGRVALAAMAQDKAMRARRRAGEDGSVDNDAFNAKLQAEAETERETCAAGAALSRAIRSLQVPS